MEIKDLSATPVETVIECFLKSFQKYFVKLPADKDYWKDRFKKVKVDWALSYGAFDHEKLVGFIINGIDQHNGRLTAYNTGTGVLPDYRGLQLVDKMYEQAFPELKKKGVQKCLLEVIVENEPAKKVYNRIGFSVVRDLHSFSGKLCRSHTAVRPEKIPYSKISETGLYDPQLYCWESRAEAVRMEEEVTSTYMIKNEEGEITGYFTLGQAGNIIQLQEKENDFSSLLDSITSVEKQVKLKNIPSGRKELINELQKRGFKNLINQHEMELELD